MADNIAFEIRLRDLTPEATSLSDLAKLLNDADKALRALVETVELVEESDLVVGLVDIVRGSNVLRFGSPQVERAQTMWRVLTDAVAEDKAHTLPEPTKAFVESMVAVARKRNTAVELADAPLVAPRVVIDPLKDLTLRVPTVVGETDIYGVVSRIGGADPKIRITLDEGYPISCSTTHQLARQLGSRLYERVGLRGTAIWNTSDWSIQSFRVTEILEYQDTPLREAIAELATASGPSAWADETDIEQAIAKLRQE